MVQREKIRNALLKAAGQAGAAHAYLGHAVRAAFSMKNAPADFGRSEVDVLKFFAAGSRKTVAIMIKCLS